MGPRPPAVGGVGWGMKWCLNTLVFLCRFLWKSERAELVVNETVFSISVFPIRWHLSGLGVGRGSDPPGTQALLPGFLPGQGEFL